MKIVRYAKAVWRGTVPQGTGLMQLGRGGSEIPFSLKSRTEDNEGTNPEELLGAAHAGCFSMSLSNLLEEAGTPADEVNTTARVVMEQTESGFSITRVELTTRGSAPGVDAETFARLAEEAKATCPVSRLFASAEITLDAALAD